MDSGPPIGRRSRIVERKANPSDEGKKNGEEQIENQRTSSKRAKKEQKGAGHKKESKKMKQSTIARRREKLGSRKLCRRSRWRASQMHLRATEVVFSCQSSSRKKDLDSPFFRTSKKREKEFKEMFFHFAKEKKLFQ